MGAKSGYHSLPVRSNQSAHSALSSLINKLSLHTEFPVVSGKNLKRRAVSKKNTQTLQSWKSGTLGEITFSTSFWCLMWRLTEALWLYFVWFYERHWYVKSIPKNWKKNFLLYFMDALDICICLFVLLFVFMNKYQATSARNPLPEGYNLTIKGSFKNPSFK